MHKRNNPDSLLESLAAWGIPATVGEVLLKAKGFPLVVPLENGQNLLLDLPEPALLADMNPSHVGVAVLDHMGYPMKSWGLAASVPLLRTGQCLLETDLALLIQEAFRGTSGSMYHSGYRFHVSRLHLEQSFHVIVLVTDASEERELREIAEQAHLQAETLKRVGKALNMNQNLNPLCTAVVHELASATDLAAALLWVTEPETQVLNLISHVGANRQGIQNLQTLMLGADSSCLAEICADSRRSFRLNSVHENLMTAHLEAKFCYLQPGGLFIIPLMVGDKVIGILELIGKASDTKFEAKEELFETIAEHLSLALNTSMMYDSVESLATKDPLTGIANHRAMQEFLFRRVAESTRTRSEVGVIMIDVDHFRMFNEEEGHDIGDLVLRKVVEVIKTNIRPYDLAARYGGEEFTIILPGATAEVMHQVADRIRARIEELEIVTHSGRVRHVTASLGGAIFPHNSRDAAGLIRAADRALFTAKKAGRNCVRHFEELLENNAETQSIDFDRVENWLTPADHEAGSLLRKKCEAYIPVLETSLALTRNQVAMLRALLLLLPRFLRAKTENDTQTLEGMDRAPELRTIIPALSTLDERYDGKGPRGVAGPKLPLLTRVLHVLLALEEGSEMLAKDPLKYDPDIVDLIAQLGNAA